MYQVQLLDPEFVFRQTGLLTLSKPGLYDSLIPKQLTQIQISSMFSYFQDTCLSLTWHIIQDTFASWNSWGLQDATRVLPGRYCGLLIIPPPVSIFSETISTINLTSTRFRNNPLSFELSGRTELAIWAITFLRSTQYIKNPFLKAKINEVRSPTGIKSTSLTVRCNVGVVLRYSQLRTRAQRRIRWSSQHTPVRTQAPYAGNDVFLHW